MESSLRESGIERIGQLPWGMHVCQFYRERSDLLEILVPYFRAGLEANEYCMWVTSEPLGVEDARAALREAVPDLDARIARGQIDILPHDQWYLLEGRFDLDRVLRGWEARLNDALARGFEGLRVTGNTAWLEQSHWDDFAQYEAAINGVIGRLRMMAVCTYSVGRCGASEVIDVVGNHQFALVKRANGWHAVENSERKRMAEALRETEKRFQMLFHHMSVGCAYHEVLFEGDRPVDYVFRELNGAFEQLTGLRREEILDRRVTDVLPGIREDAFDWIGTYGRVAATGEPTRFERRSGPLGRWYSVSAYSPARGTFVALFEDVTERHLAEERREDLIRAVTHDLRSPLSVVSTTAQTIQAHPEIAPRRIDAVLRSCESMDAMLRDLAEMARLDAGPIRLERQPVEVAAFLGDVVKRLGSAAGAGRIRLSVAPGVPAVDADPNRLERVVVNLVTNALKYSQGEVLVEADLAGEQVAISVSDRGAGIAPEDLPHLFERFFRARSAKSKEGLGLGLFIARTLVEAHGGILTAHSEPGRGSRFTVALPARAA